MNHVCANCSRDFTLSETPSQALFACPHCGEDNFIVVADDKDADGAMEISPPEDELDKRRIDQISRLRRAEHRRRSHSIIAATACVIATAQFILIGARQIHRGENSAAVTSVIFAVGCSIALVYASKAVLKRDQNS